MLLVASVIQVLICANLQHLIESLVWLVLDDSKGRLIHAFRVKRDKGILLDPVVGTIVILLDLSNGFTILMP